jgi:2,4-dienoyl-CoA reductase (NADPH2)
LDIEEAVPFLRRLVDAVHEYDTKIFAEPMTSFGRLAGAHGGDIDAIAPSSIPLVMPEDSFPEIMTVPGGRVMKTPREAAIPEIVALEDDTARSAVIAREAGFDGVEIGAHMSYLVRRSLPRAATRGRRVRRQLREPHAVHGQIVRKTRTGWWGYPVG